MAYISSYTGTQHDNQESRINTLESLVSTLLNNITNMWNTIYPIGSIYISLNNISPATLFGGTWLPIYSRMLIGAGGYNEANTHNAFGSSPANTLLFTAGEMGGELLTTLTINEMPSHGHYIVQRQQWYNADTVVSASAGTIYSWKSGTGGTTSPGYTSGYNDISSSGGGAPHNNMPPYLAVYMWKRTA